MSSDTFHLQEKERTKGATVDMQMEEIRKHIYRGGFALRIGPWSQIDINGAIFDII